MVTPRDPPCGMIVTLRTGSAPGTSNPSSACPDSWYAMRSRSPGVSIRWRSVPSRILSIASKKSAEVTAVSAFSRRAEGRLVDQVAEVGADQARGCAGDLVEVDVRRQRHLGGVDLEDRSPATPVGRLQSHAPVEPARAATEPGSRTSARFVAARTMTPFPGSNPSISVRIWLSVCSCSSLLPRRMPGAAAAPDGVELVDEDDRGRRLARLGRTGRARARRRRRRWPRRTPMRTG